MVEQLSKTLLDHFESNLEDSFSHYCQKHHANQTEILGLIRYLIDYNLIRSTTIKRYVILKEYQKMRLNASYKKVEIVAHLADRFNLSERSVYTILKEYKDLFEKR